MKTFLNTAYGKIIAVLTIIALVMGIAFEAIQLETGYYAMLKQQAETRALTRPAPSWLHDQENK
jgi:hypothetical protein